MKPANIKKSSLLLFAALAASLSLNPAARAANGADTWVGTASALFSTGGWTGANNPPISGDSLVFGTAGTAGTALTADQTAGISYAGITFNSGAPAYTIGSANGITLTGNIVNNGTSLETLNFPIAATASRTFTTTVGGGDITLGGAFTGSGGGITKAGSGNLNLSGVNSFSGTFIANAGQVNITANSTTSSAGFNNLGNTASTTAIVGISSGATLTWSDPTAATSAVRRVPAVRFTTAGHLTSLEPQPTTAALMCPTQAMPTDIFTAPARLPLRGACGWLKERAAQSACWIYPAAR